MEQSNLDVVVAEQAVVNNSRISCSFSRKKKVADPAEEVHEIDDGMYYYILMARGEVDTGWLAVYAKLIDTLISAQMQTLIANISGTDSDIDRRKTALLPTTPPALGKKSGELWSTNSSAPLLAAILKAYVCVCVCVWFCPRHRSALVRACAAAAYLSGRKWLEGCYCCQPASFFSAHLCLSAQAFYPLTMFGYQCRLGLSTVVGPGV